MTSTLRNLNDYECMLASMTCTVGIEFQMTCPSTTTSTNSTTKDEESSHSYCVQAITRAWKNTMSRYEFLQTHLQARTDDQCMGMLGPRFAVLKNETAVDNCCIEFIVTDGAHDKTLLEQLQENGTTKVDWLKSMYHLAFISDGQTTSTSYRMILCLCHSLSDGPGTLAVVHYFLEQLSLCIKDVSHGTTDACLSCIDLQSDLLGDDYGATREPKDCFSGAESVLSGLGHPEKCLEDGSKLLVPEAMQGLPKPGKDDSGAIEALSLELSRDETNNLIQNCKSNHTTIQAALTVAFLLARLHLLGTELPCSAPLQIPMNCRKLSAAQPETLATTCLCGSAGLWQLLLVQSNSKVLSDLASRSSEMMRQSMEDEQPLEWLRRLMNDPASLAPSGLMMSSIGVAPASKQYGDNLIVDDLVFFGGAKRPPTPSGNQATMGHAQTFDGRFHLTFNYLGIDRSFAEKSVAAIETLLKMMASEDPDTSVDAAIEMLRAKY